MISINTDNVSLINSGRGPSPDAKPEISISDIDDDGLRTVTFSFKIGAGDWWSLSASKGVGDDKKVIGFGQGSTHQEKPEVVIEKMNSWLQEENKAKEDKIKNIISWDDAVKTAKRKADFDKLHDLNNDWPNIN